jgi:5-methylcytosine-specific restriction enzyme A
MTNNRPSARKRGYDAAWERVRRDFLRAHPVCSVPGCGCRATDVDHVERVRDKPSRRLDPTNLVAYCHAHHSAKTAAEDGGFGNPATGKRRPVLGVDRSGRPLDPDHPWHRPQGGI